MTCMNLVVIAVLYGSQSNLIEIINGKEIAKTVYRLVASLAIFSIFFYVPLHCSIECRFFMSSSPFVSIAILWPLIVRFELLAYL